MSYFVKLPTLEQTAPIYLDVIDGTTTAVQRHLRKFGAGGYEPTFQSTMLAICSKMDRIVLYDIGAHIGFYSALVSSLFKNATCIAFEPTPGTHKITTEIRDRNHLPYFVAKRALSDKNEVLSFYLSPKGESSNSLNPEFRPGAKATKVKAMTLDNYVSGGVPAPTLLKIDVETHEPEMLMGAHQTIEAHKPKIMCELLNKLDKSRLAPQLEWLAGLGYSFYNLTDDLEFVRHDATSIIANSTEFISRDWLFSIEPIDDLKDGISRWAEALKSCGQETNIAGATVA